MAASFPSAAPRTRRAGFCLILLGLFRVRARHLPPPRRPAPVILLSSRSVRALALADGPILAARPSQSPSTTGRPARILDTTFSRETGRQVAAGPLYLKPASPPRREAIERKTKRSPACSRCWPARGAHAAISAGCASRVFDRVVPRYQRSRSRITIARLDPPARSRRRSFELYIHN